MHIYATFTVAKFVAKPSKKLHLTATATTLALANLGDTSQIWLVLYEAYNAILHHTRLQKESVVAYAVMEGFFGSFAAQNLLSYVSAFEQGQLSIP
jgi:hypothetical protein